MAAIQETYVLGPNTYTKTVDGVVTVTRAMTAQEITIETALSTGVQREARITAAIPVLRQWASDARGTTVTAGNAVATLQVVVNRLGVFFDNFADLLQSLGKG